jgi:peptidoglycan/xylan/chitin deacetylase (PgdA/CDA1 family)
VSLTTKDRRTARARDAAQRERAMELLPELAGHPVPRRRLHHRMAALLTAVVSLAIVAAVFGGLWRWVWWQKQVGPQHVTTAQLAEPDTAAFSTAAAAARSVVPGTGAAPVVLTYHDIGPAASGSRYVVTPQAFADQMEMLDRAGYRTLTAEQFLRYQRTGEVPPRSVLITFDDGTRGLWTYADPVLARHGFTAVSFLITGSVGRHAPYYLTWPQVERMAGSGRWSFGSHTHDLHTKVTTSDGRRVSALTARGGTPEERTGIDSFRSSVRSDLEASLRDFSAHDLPRPRLFAWPFSGISGAQPDPAAAVAAEQEVARLFPVAFVNVFRPRPATVSDVRSGRVQRLEVVGDDTARSLFDRIGEMATLPVQRLSPARVDRTWLEYGGHDAPLDPGRLDAGVVTPEARTLTYLQAYWAPQRTSEWSRYRVTATLRPGEGRVGVTVRGEDPGQQVVVQASARVATVHAGGDTVASRTFSDAGDLGPTHTVDVLVTAAGTRVSVDGRTLADVPVSTTPAHGGIGVVFGRATPGMAWGAVEDLRVTPAP